MNNYQNEARERWGNTNAYREYEGKTRKYTKEQWKAVNDEMLCVFAEFSACKTQGESPNSTVAQELVAKLQAHITNHYYTCTKEILAGLGEMYTADERFQKNIDRCGAGTAAFVKEAIAVYVKR